MIASHTTANVMKYIGLAASRCPRSPAPNSAAPAPKYKIEGKYGRFDIQYIHAVRKPAASPNASRAQMYSPPSCGYREDNSITHAASGTKKPSSPKNQTISEPGPAAAAVATHRTLSDAAI